MTDIYDTTIVCDKCDKKTRKAEAIKDGFRLRVWECPECGKIWYHPLDKQEYDNFYKLKEKRFNVKLRLVGNSYAVSIPREIIDFEEEMNKEIAKMIQINLDEPDRLTIYFSKRIRKMLR